MSLGVVRNTFNLKKNVHSLPKLRHWSFYYGAQTKQFRSLVISPGVFYYELLFVGQVELIILFTDCSVHICPQFC